MVQTLQNHLRGKHLTQAACRKNYDIPLVSEIQGGIMPSRSK